jgi:hypothetical protein
MAYFSSKSTWLSLVEGPENLLHGDSHADGHPLSFQDYRPALASSEALKDVPVPSGPGEGDTEGDAYDPSEGHIDMEQLRLTRELRHRLFFQHQEWEFGPALLSDLLLLGRGAINKEEALAHYCQARHVAKVLVEQCDRPEFLVSWLETDRMIAELHHLLGNFDSCAMYAQEGLGKIKCSKFDPSMDMRITRLAIRFFQLLGRH